jgi:hypothetical protein
MQILHQFNNVNLTPRKSIVNRKIPNSNIAARTIYFKKNPNPQQLNGFKLIEF